MNAHQRADALFNNAKAIGLLNQITGDGAPTRAAVAEAIHQAEEDATSQKAALAWKLYRAKIVIKALADYFAAEDGVINEMTGTETTGQMKPRFRDLDNLKAILLTSAKDTLDLIDTPVCPGSIEESEIFRTDVARAKTLRNAGLPIPSDLQIASRFIDS